MHHDHDDQDRTFEERQHAIVQNLRSIEHVPVRILPADSPARILLTALASLGADCSADPSGGAAGTAGSAWIEDRRIPLSDSYHVLAYALAALTRVIGEELAALDHDANSLPDADEASSSSSSKEGPR